MRITRTLHILLLLIAGVFISSLGASASFGCPPLTTLGILFSWPPNLVVDINPGNVPSGSVTTALNNWYNALLPFGCAPILAIGANPPFTNTLSWGSIPPPTNCPSGPTCVTRGQTTYVATYGGRLET